MREKVKGRRDADFFFEGGGEAIGAVGTIVTIVPKRAIEAVGARGCKASKGC